MVWGITEAGEGSVHSGSENSANDHLHRWDWLVPPLPPVERPWGDCYDESRVHESVGWTHHWWRRQDCGASSFLLSFTRRSRSIPSSLLSFFRFLVPQTDRWILIKVQPKFTFWLWSRHSCLLSSFTAILRRMPKKFHVSLPNLEQRISVLKLVWNPSLFFYGLVPICASLNLSSFPRR